MQQNFIYGGFLERVTPQSYIFIGFSIINHPFCGSPLHANPHIYICIYAYIVIYIYAAHIYNVYIYMVTDTRADRSPGWTADDSRKLQNWRSSQDDRLRQKKKFRGGQRVVQRLFCSDKPEIIWAVFKTPVGWLNHHENRGFSCFNHQNMERYLAYSWWMMVGWWLVGRFYYPIYWGLQ